jgi:hypothetical protein
LNAQAISPLIQEIDMKALTHTTRSTHWLAACAFVAAGMALVHPAHAADVFWTVGIQQPGVNVTVGNAPPAPVIVSQPPVVAQVPVIMQPAPVVVRPTPVVVAQPQVVYVPERHHPHGHAWGYGYGREHERRDYAYGYGRGYDHDRR